jgi:hypothetical protein
MPYYNHMSASLRAAAEESRADGESLRSKAQANNKEFNDRVWKDLEIIYGRLFPMTCPQ